MRAVACQHGELDLVERPEPDPGPGQVRIEVVRCGICGSDLHARHGIDQWAEMAVKAGYDRFGSSAEQVVFGHEFSGRVAEYGSECREDVPTDTPVVALPLLRGAQGVDLTGLSPHAPGAYAEQLLVQESMMMAVPERPRPRGRGADRADGGGAARRSPRGGRQAGRGDRDRLRPRRPRGDPDAEGERRADGRRQRLLVRPAGARRALRGRHRRRSLAGVPLRAAGDPGWLSSLPDALELALDTREKLGRLPGVGWWRPWRLAERLGLGPKRPVVFECVGVPGVIASIVDSAPLFSRVVVAGVCVGPDTFTPAMAINKEIDLRFVLGYTPPEFRETLHMLAEGKVDPSPMITGTVGLAGVSDAFADLEDPERHAKILIDPSLP